MNPYRGAFFACIICRMHLKIGIYVSSGVFLRDGVMKKILLYATAVGLLWAASANAQTIWGFDDNNDEIYIPVQCDGQFDEENGGAFMPTPRELYEQGELLLEGDKTQQAQAGYCFMSAALQDNVEAQYKLAQMFDKGIGVPQNEINAYKWAYLAALSGNQDAERLALVLEQFLSAEDIESATKDVQSALPKIKNEKQSQISIQDSIIADKKAKLESINQEIDLILGVKYVVPVRPALKVGTSVAEPPTAATDAAPATVGDRRRIIFSEQDRL